MRSAASEGYVEIVKLFEKWGATDFDKAMRFASSEGYVEIVNLCRGWLGYDSIYHELLRHHHKRKFFEKIRDEVLPIAWHPDRFFELCVDEEEKGFLEEMQKEV